MTINPPKYVFLFTLVIISTICFGQNINSNEDESFFTLQDSILKKELSAFTITGAGLDSISPVKLKLLNVPLRNCKDNEVYLTYSTFFGPINTHIHILFKGVNPNKSVDSIFLVTHSHFVVRFPKEAFIDLPQINLCNFTPAGKKSNYISPYYKSYYSENHRRLYIYMQGGTMLKKYEVTWIIINDKFHSRIIDTIP